MALMGAGVGIAHFLPELNFGGLIFGVGVVITFFGFFALPRSPAEFFEEWSAAEADQLYKAIKEAETGTTLRIQQTWWADREKIIPHLEEVLRSGRRLTLQALLLDTDPDDGGRDTDEHHPDVLAARVKLRWATCAKATGWVQDTVRDLKRLRANASPGRLDLQIRVYDFLPFGPLYQVGESTIFVGFYLNDRSSINGPMVKITDRESYCWKTFRHQFDTGWDNAKSIS
jgi:hypothetical protein